MVQYNDTAWWQVLEIKQTFNKKKKEINKKKKEKVKTPMTMVYWNLKEVNSRLANPSLKFDDDEAKHGLVS